RVTLDDPIDTPFRGKILLIILEMDNDACSTRRIGGWLNLVTTHPFRKPTPSGFLRFVRAAGDNHFFRDHKRRVKTNAKLPDQTDVRFFPGLERGEKGLRAGMGDRPKILDQLGMSHANAGIAESNRAFLFVRLNRDFQPEFGLMYRLPGTLKKSELLE